MADPQGKSLTAEGRHQRPRASEAMSMDIVRYWLRNAEERQSENHWAKKFVEAVSFLLPEETR